MGIQYQNLDETTRSHMLDEIALGNHYMSARLTPDGLNSWPAILEEAARLYNDDWIAEQLLVRGYLRSEESYTRNGKNFIREINKQSAASSLAEGEFNRMYVRGLCVRAIATGQDSLIVYRGKAVTTPRPESESKIGSLISTTKLLQVLRSNDFVSLDSALGVPAGPNSGLTCRLQ